MSRSPGAQPGAGTDGQPSTEDWVAIGAVLTVLVSSGAIGWASFARLGEQGVDRLVGHGVLVREPVVLIALGAGLDWPRLLLLGAVVCLVLALLLLGAHRSRVRS